MKKPSVHVVDDEVQIGTLLTRMLERDGYSVRAFASGEAAVAAMHADPPDVLVTDLLMPGMSGLDLIRRTHAISPRTATVLTTGYASTDDLIDALRAGADDFVAKPFDIADIRDVVARVLTRRRPIAAPEFASPNLARRLGDLAVIEAIHALFTLESTPAELLARCADTLTAAIGVQRALLLESGGAPHEFRVAGTLGLAAANSCPLGSDPLAGFANAGTARLIDASVLGEWARLFEECPLAAIELTGDSSHNAQREILVVAREPGSGDFESEDLRVLGVFARAFGGVLAAARSAGRGEAAYADSLCDIVTATESRSAWFSRHSQRVRHLSLPLGRRVGLGDHDLAVLDIASRLLDLGRVDMSDELLGKPGSPNAEEWNVLRRHTTRADDLVRPIGRLRHAKPVIRHHHENWDGSGYPAGLRGDEIPYLAALVRITDSYAALTSPRAWRPALAKRDAMRQIEDLSGRHFHPGLVAEFAGIEAVPAEPPEPLQ